MEEHKHEGHSPESHTHHSEGHGQHEHKEHAHHEHETHKEHHVEHKAESPAEKKAESREGHAHKKKAPHKPAAPTKGTHKAPKKKEFNYVPYVIGGIVVILIIALIVKLMSQPSAVEIDDPGQYGSVDVTFYVMSQCPYGIQVENAIQPVLDEFNENVNFRLEFIASETATGFDSLHGAPEVVGDKVQLCVQDMYPAELMDFVVCQNKDPRDLVASVEKCAKGTSIDSAKVIECAEGEQGNSLLSESIKNSQDAGAQGSPTMYFGGELYSGARDATSFKRAICAGLDKHPLCEALPACGSDADCRAEEGKVGICENPGKKDAKCTYREDAAVTMKILNAKDCANCDASQIVFILSQVFLNMDVEMVEASTAEGKAMIQKYGLEHAPSLVFVGDLDNTYAWEQNERIQAAFRKVGDDFVMIDEATGSTYLLDAQKRAEFEKLTGVKKGDNRPQIDFYVMSYCPYGNIAEEAIEPAYQLLKGKADFNPHYVIYSNYGGGGPNYCLDEDAKYCSMHGVQEMNQGLRELCVAKYIGMDAYFKFVLEMNAKCNYQNADSCWEAVAKGLKLDTAKIKDCEANEWDDLLSKELELNKALGVSGSPTVFVEGQAYAGARTPAGYAQALCAEFETAPSACSASSLSALGDTQAAASGSC
ncbi:hypothetical protein KY359_01575 [Candidatus Woesearchaeota archaeon]|nr:hypothetical protein [Candidatus Woesearchaeota archaeon]